MGQSIPKYVKIKDDILTKIRKGQLKPGDKLPLREELIHQYSVTRTTLNKAIEELLDSGILKAIRRQGTFVAEKKITLKTAIITRLSEVDKMEPTGIFHNPSEMIRNILFNTRGKNITFLDIKEVYRNLSQTLSYDVTVWIQPSMEQIQALTPYKNKCLIVNRYVPEFNFISTNHREAVKEMTEKLLLKLGDNSQVFFLQNDKMDFVGKERKEGFLEACSKYQKFYRIIPDCINYEKTLKSLMELKLDKNKKILMVSPSHSLTGPVLKMMPQKKLVFAQNFFYCDFDNSDSLERVGLKIPSALQDYRQMGIEIVKALDKIGLKPVKTYVPYSLVNI